MNYEESTTDASNVNRDLVKVKYAPIGPKLGAFGINDAGQLIATALGEDLSGCVVENGRLIKEGLDNLAEALRGFTAVALSSKKE